MMRRIALAALLLGGTAVAARAASPTQGGYQWDPARLSITIPSMVMTWFDPNNPAIPGGAPRPASPDWPLPVADAQSAAFQGVVAMTPGTTYPALRSLGFVCTAAGQITVTLADGSSLTVGIVASPAFQSLPFAATQVALGSGTAGTFWNLK